MFRNSAYDITALMKITLDLEDEHALGRGQWQVTAKVTSLRDQGEAPPDSDVGTNPLLEAESQIRAFMREVSAWISDCRAWNTEYKLARARNAQARTGTGNQNLVVVGLIAMAKGGPHNISSPKGEQLRMDRINIVRGTQHHRINHKPNPASSVKTAHLCAINKGVGNTSAKLALVPNTTRNRDE